MNINRVRSTRRALVAALIAVAAAPAAHADAYSVAPGWVASDYATEFPFATRTQVGPIGLAFDDRARLLVTDPAAGVLYRIPAGGGRAPAHVLRELPGGNAGLAFDGLGRLFMARADRGDIVQIAPGTGEQVRVRARGLACPVGLATDPLSGDLFASNVACDAGTVTRVRASGAPEPYVTGRDIDGITFAPDGTLYASDGGAVLRIDGTDRTAGPTRVEVLAHVPGADGLVYAPATSGDGPFLLVTSRDGTIKRVDLDGRVSTVLSGGSRGDLVTVGPDRCMYATQRDRIVRVGPARGSCAFAASPPFGVTGSAGEGSPAIRGTSAGRRVVDTAVALRAPRRVGPGRRAAITVIGRNRSRRPAHQVTVVEAIPRRARLTAIRASRGVHCVRRPRALFCRKRVLAARSALRVRIMVRPGRTSRLVNLAAIGSRDLDPAPGNNRARSTTRVRRRAM